MSVEVIKILSRSANTAINEIRGNLSATGTTATGNTARSLNFEIDQDGDNLVLRIFGRGYFTTVETGRKATPQYDKPSREFVAAIREWAKAKGVNAPAYAIARSIHKRGTELFRKGGREDIIQPVEKSLLDNIAEEILDAYADEFLRESVKLYKK